MADDPSELAQYILRGREERNLEYKGARGLEPFSWEINRVRAKIAKTAMAMANIGGGVIVIGMYEVAPDEWSANGVPSDVDASYRQDEVQQYVTQRADPYVELAVRHIDHGGKRFVIIQVAGFADLPVVCSIGFEQVLRAAALYTRSFGKHETVEIRTQSEMRELLDQAIAVGVTKRLEPFVAALRNSTSVADEALSASVQFARERGDL